ncbi:MAG: LysR family transcriptional regulator [Lachnospiraceae bacterium]|jgi:LysR family transcriptional activator of glutamate synthase operon
MNLDHLRYFETVARLEHYGKAAELLHITQPNLSHAIAQLEGELGVPLFEKTGRNIRLTRYGKAFLDSVSYSLEHLDHSIHSLQETKNGGGLLVLGCIRNLGTSMIPAFMRDFQKTPQGQNVTFQLHTGSSFSSVLLEQTLEGRYDLVFTSQPGSREQFESFEFYQSPFVAAVSPNHPLAGSGCIELRQTLEFPHIFLSQQSGLRPAIDELFYQIGVFPQISYETEEDFVAAGLAAAGFGIAILPEHPFLHTLNLTLLRISQPNPQRYAYLSMPKYRWNSQAAVNFYHFCCEQLADTPSAQF